MGPAPFRMPWSTATAAMALRCDTCERQIASLPSEVVDADGQRDCDGHLVQGWEKSTRLVSQIRARARRSAHIATTFAPPSTPGGIA